VVHDVNQGRRRSGKAAFREFSKHMERCYAEQLENMAVMATALKDIRGYASAGRCVVSGHARQRMRERNVREGDLRNAWWW
jgi:hypothetical protein